MMKKKNHYNCGSLNPMFGKKNPAQTERMKNRTGPLNPMVGMVGENSLRWKDGECFSNGRIFIYSPEHPFCYKNRYVRRSHLVWELNSGVRVQPGEVIHHIDGNPMNDEPENLQWIKNQSDHARLEHKIREGRRITDRTCVSISSPVL
jgi:hypothetical protein